MQKLAEACHGGFDFDTLPDLPAEDAIGLATRRSSQPAPVKIRAPMLSRIANFDDADPLRLEAAAVTLWIINPNEENPQYGLNRTESRVGLKKVITDTDSVQYCERSASS